MSLLATSVNVNASVEYGDGGEILSVTVGRTDITSQISREHLRALKAQVIQLPRSCFPTQSHYDAHQVKMMTPYQRTIIHDQIDRDFENKEMK